MFISLVVFAVHPLQKILLNPVSMIRFMIIILMNKRLQIYWYIDSHSGQHSLLYYTKQRGCLIGMLLATPHTTLEFQCVRHPLIMQQSFRGAQGSSAQRNFKRLRLSRLGLRLGIFEPMDNISYCFTMTQQLYTIFQKNLLNI